MTQKTTPPAITRFAPSPTGYIHIGNVRSAIYPFLLAKQTGGEFILRIEDTDRSRFVADATDLIFDTLEWLGLKWDRGPRISADAENYIQSNRSAVYLHWAQKLLESGRAYADPTPSSVIDEYRKSAQSIKTPYLYRNYRPATTTPWQPGIPIRFRAEPKPYQWHDEVMGDLSSGPEVLDDIILIKADGLPTYNFAHIVDDAEMGVTHVIRGSEYLSSMPNYLALYEALSLERPKFVSLPHILAPTGGKKLSKRDGAKSVTEYRDMGILPEAMLNFLACLGWNDGTEDEIYSMSDLVERFSIDRIQNSGARFDENKLLWLNGQWIRKIATEQGIDYLLTRVAGFWPEIIAIEDKSYPLQVLEITYDRLKTLSDISAATYYFFTEPEIDLSQITNCKFLKKFEQSSLCELLQRTIAALETCDWDADSLQAALNTLLTNYGLKPAELFSLIRISVSFAPFSPAIHLTLHVLGKERSLSRMRAVQDALSR